MSYDPATTGEVSWDGPPPDDEPSATKRETERTIGFGASEIGAATWLPDDPKALVAAIEQDGRPFHGAFVPLVIHDPLLAERSYDAAEWAADLIRTAGGQCLCIAPFADKDAPLEAPLSPRQWNHTAAMVERLDELCARFRLRPVVSDLIGAAEARGEGGLDPELPIHYVLDAGSFVPDGHVPARLISPEKVGTEELPPAIGDPAAQLG